MEGFISTQEAAVELGVTVGRVIALIKAGRLRAERMGTGRRSIYLIAPADLETVRDRKPGRPMKLKATEPEKRRGKAAEPKPAAKGKQKKS
jgi:excisionase family DNA binding protein